MTIRNAIILHHVSFYQVNNKLDQPHNTAVDNTLQRTVDIKPNSNCDLGGGVKMLQNNWSFWDMAKTRHTDTNSTVRTVINRSMGQHVLSSTSDSWPQNLPQMTARNERSINGIIRIHRLTQRQLNYNLWCHIFSRAGYQNF